MADWDSADLLARCRDEAQEPETGTNTTAAQWYRLMTQSQHTVYRLFAQHVPHVLVSAPAAMTSSDGGATYVVPSSAFALGYAEIRHGRNGPLLLPGADFSDRADFVWEGDRIRIPHGKTRTFSNGLYIRHIAPPGTIDANTEPTLEPDWSRILIVYDAVKQWAGQGNLRDPAVWAAKYREAAYGDGVDGGILGTLKSQLVAQGADTGLYQSTAYWWRQLR